jgi:hypothetical protein
MIDTISTRRVFFKQAALASAAIGSLASSTACWLTGSVFTQILSYINVGLQAFQAVVNLLAPSAAVAVTAAITLVKAGFADLVTAVDAYEAAPAADKATLLQKVSTVLSILEASIQQFWNDLKLPSGSLATTISGLLGIILSVLAGFATQLPAPAPTPATTKAKALPNLIPVTPQKMSVSQFKKAFNSKMTASGQTPVNFK